MENGSSKSYCSSVYAGADNASLAMYWLSFRCSCGKLISDKYTELRTGGIEEHQARLTKQTSCDSHSFWQRASYICENVLEAMLISCFPILIIILTTVLILRSCYKVRYGARMKQTKPRDNRLATGFSNANIPSGDRTTSHGAAGLTNAGNSSSLPRASGNLDLNGQGPTSIPRILLRFQERGRWFGLHQQPLKLNEIKNDRTLFEFLKRVHMDERDRITLRLAIKVVIQVEFIAFTADLHQKVDLRPHDQIYCAGRDASSCVLPSKAHLLPPDPQYSYSPGDASDVCPPWGPNHMTHWFKHPECIHERQTYVLNQIPKCLRRELPSSLDAPARGWGLSLKEAWNYWPLMALFLLPPIVFAIAWSSDRRDIQGRFSVASFYLAAGTVAHMCREPHWV